MTFGESLKQWRKRRGLTQQELADVVGINISYVSNLERDFSATSKLGKPRPSVELVEKIARVLNVDADEARIAAGYAPEHLTHAKPQNLSDLFHILDDMGIDGIQFADEDALRSASPEQLQELLDSIRVAVEVTLNKQRRGRIPHAPQNNFSIRE